MTSALNHRRPLSGNKNLAAIGFAFLVLLVSACKASKPVQISELTPIAKPASAEPQTTVVSIADKKDSLPSEKMETEPAKKETPAPVSQKTTYNIAVVLPFNIHQVPLDYLPYQVDTSMSLSADVRQSLDFFMGFKMAADEYVSKNATLNVFVLDDANNSETVRRMKNSRPFPEVDLMIGANQIYVANELLAFAEEKNISLISPFITDAGEKLSSSKFYEARPSYKTHVGRLLDKSQQLYPEQSIQVIYDPGHDSSRLLLQFAKESGVGNITPIAFSPFGESTPKLDSLLNGKVVLIASTRDNYVKAVVQQLALFDVPLLILGMPECAQMKNIDWATAGKHQIFISVSSAPASATALKAFKDKFEQEFQMPDNEQVAMGYDLGRYILMLTDAGLLEKMPSSNDIGVSPLMFGYAFEPVLDQRGKILRNRNTSVHFMKWQTNRFVKD